jgi:DNA repair protein RadC
MKISQGGISGSVVDIKIICKYAIECLGCSVILVHNHPSGNRNPSQEDLNITKKIKQALSIFDIGLFDHIILTANSYYSFADEGIL